MGIPGLEGLEIWGVDQVFNSLLARNTVGFREGAP